MTTFQLDAYEAKRLDAWTARIASDKPVYALRQFIVHLPDSRMLSLCYIAANGGEVASCTLLRALAHGNAEIESEVRFAALRDLMQYLADGIAPAAQPSEEYEDAVRSAYWEEAKRRRAIALSEREARPGKRRASRSDRVNVGMVSEASRLVGRACVSGECPHDHGDYPCFVAAEGR